MILCPSAALPTATIEAGDPPPSASRSTSSRKRSRPSEAAAGDDLISVLPDALLLHVLSFLDVKNVVKTSALSRRWSSLWTQTSALSIDIWATCVCGHGYSLFDRFLLLCTSPAIRELHLLSRSYNVELKEKLDLWIRFAVGHRVEDLCIQVDENADDEAYVLPRVLLRCESLTRLWVELCGFPSFTNGNLGMISWSSLKVLSVRKTKMVDEVITAVLEGSPLLESLTLDSCYGMNSIRIFSKVMRELVISRYCDPDEEFSDEEDENRHHKNFGLEIFVPYLRSMQLLGQWEGKEVVVLRQVLSLVDVELNFNLKFNEMNLDIIYGTMKGILTELRFVDKVMIGNEILMYLHNYKGNGDFSLQMKCRHLTITTLADKYSLGRIAEVLECAPNVETLVIDFTPEIYSKVTNEDPVCNKFESWKRFTCGIRNVEIIGFPASYGVEPIYWLSLIKVLHRDVHVLEKMAINAKRSWGRPGLSLKEAHTQEVLKVAADILGYPRGSKAAKVILNYPFKGGGPRLD